MTITAIEVALIFHAIRFIAARLATAETKWVATTGAAIGGAFTFGGHP